jgi:NDP-sugar pyrophosphorylase family protein
MNDPGMPPGGVVRARHVPRALVLTAGLGTRLAPLTYVRAKAAVPVNGETLARRVVSWLVSQDVRDLILNLHHQPATIAASVGDGGDLGAHVRYSWEQPLLGSAGGPRHALPLLVNPAEDGGGTFIIVNGDTLTDVDLASMAAAHVESRAAVTMALIPNPRPDKYGGVQVADRWVAGFTRRGSAGASYHFIGVQIVESRVFAHLDDGVPAETVARLYPELIARDERSIGAFISNASFRDIGTPADYLRTSAELAAIEGDRMRSGLRTRIDPSARVVRSAVWDDVTIGPGAELVDCIVCDRVVIPAGARYHGCAIVAAHHAQGRKAGARDRTDGALLITEIA